MRALLGCALLLLLAGCSSPSSAAPTAAPTREPGTIAITALLDLSGPRAAIGTAQRNALQLWSDDQQSAGRLKVRWKAVDVAASEARTIIELRRASAEDAADAVIVGAQLASFSETLVGAVELAGLPVLLTLPAPGPPVSGGRWLFALAPQPDRVDALISADLARRGIIDPVRLAPRDADSLRSPAELADVRAVRLTGAPKEYPQLGELLKKVTVQPAVYGSYLTGPNDLGDLRDLNTLWPGSRYVTADADRSVARRNFVKAYGDRHGAPGTWAATAYDALTIITAAAERSATLTHESLRDRLEETSLVGIATSYVFSRSTHTGALAEDFVLLRWGGNAATASVP